jgi:tetratricopeptide (TPR) repeat protein
MYSLLALLLLLAGCAGVPTQPPVQSPAQAPAQATFPDTLLPDVIPPSPDQGGIVEPVPKPVMSGNPAVVALLDRAQLDTAAGHREAAGASLERGLRIEPRNAWLWHELAQLRLAGGQYAQAISLARKSISFAGRDKRLLASDWRVIGNARVALGNPTEAEQAFKLATDIELAAKAEADHGF